MCELISYLGECSTSTHTYRETSVASFLFRVASLDRRPIYRMYTLS